MPTPITLPSGALVEGPLDPTLPLVVLLHGLGGLATDMTAPMAGRPGIWFDHSGWPPLYVDRGFAPYPPLLPASDFFMDPPRTSLTSWRQALLAAGFSTVTYTQVGPLIANDVAQLTTIATEINAHPELSGLRVAMVAHSRGGLVARAFLTAAAASPAPALASFMSRMTSLITLHSPHLGSGVANIAGTVNGLLMAIRSLLVGLAGPGAGAFLTSLIAMVGSPAIAELAVGSPTAMIGPGEPVPGVTYHTFGGTSTVFARLFANVYTPDSYAPWPVPWPFFHWGATPGLVGAPLEASSFIPSATLLAVIPEIPTLVTLMTTLEALTPELRLGAGDVLVSDALSRLPFSASHTTNALNHAEALADPTLQAQVIAILFRLRIPPPPPPVTRTANATITPYPARLTPASHRVTATDAVTGAPVTAGTVTVRDTYGHVALHAALGAPFTYGFAARSVTTHHGREKDVDLIFPTVEADLDQPYASVDVDTGH